LITAGLLAAALTGCSSGGDSSCVVPSGDASKVVSASGRFGETPNVSFPTPLDTKTLQRSVLKTGDGEKLQAGQLVVTELAFYDGESGKKLQTGEISLTAGKGNYPGLGKSMQCVPVGSRIAIAGTAKQIFGAEQVSQQGLDASHTLVLVLDLKRAFLARANGTPKPGQPGFPTVVLAPNGRPGITVPKNDPPKSPEAETLKQGHGKTVKKGDNVVVQYTAVSWDDNSVTSSSWQDGSPTGWVVGGSESSAPAGLSKFIVGSKVGSQLVVVLPADKASGSSATAYVIDVLGIH
jgi:peptidylprolyl isomerase